ncbi:XRE family transcriptional regulator [Ruminococcus sp.]|uniref:XRE family transcriptional regulator n=1 Tax=Ruminococcus sp. TaxID=41978 RepID=UPI00388F7B97
MKKSTDELLKQLKRKSNIEEFFKENGSELIFDSLSEMVTFYMNQKGLKKADVVRRSMLGNYAYSIINGNRKKPERDKLIMLCFGLKLTSEEANLLLKKSSNGELYVRNPRDLVLIYALDRNQSVIEANNKLEEFGLDELPLP